METGTPRHRTQTGGDRLTQRIARMMTFTAFLCFAACVQVMAAGTGEKISLSEKNVPIEKIFKEISKQTGYQFLYTSRTIENAKKVTIVVKEANLEEVLSRCFRQQPFSYQIIDSTIIVKPRPGGIPAPDGVNNPIEIKGRIVNDKGEPIVRASVAVKGTLVSVLTNANGEFSIPGMSEDAVLLISHVEYEDASIHVKGGAPVNAVLQIKFGSLDELQVIAYGTVTKRLNSGDVGTIKSKDIFKQPVNNPLQAMQGRVPGLFITQQTGVSGGGFNVLIRGKNSIGNLNDPLYVIDGVPFASQLMPNEASMSTYQAFGRTIPNPLNFLNVADIESIDVLKDADATAIYGTRAANGVILITTKKGRPGKMAVDVNVYSGVANVAHTMKLLNTEQYLQYRNEAFANDGATPGALDHDVNGPWDKTRYTDWQKKLIGGNARVSDAQASISGGTADLQYMINGGYHKETTVYPGNFGNNKASLHFNINSASPDKKFKVQLSGGFVSVFNHLPYNDFMTESKMYPDAPDVYDVNGNLNWANNTWNNPYARMQSASKVYSKNLLGNSTLSYELMPGLEIKTSIGYSNLQYNDVQTTPTTFFRPNLNTTTGSANFAFNTLQSWIVEPQLKYRFTVSDGKFDVLVGSTIQQNQTDGNTISATGYTDNSLLESLAAASSISKGTAIINSKYKYNAVFARVNYNWRNKYILNLTGRRDGSSRFGPDKQFNNFAAAGAAWIFSNEAFVMNALPALSFGKIRASYGTTGSDQTGDYRFLDTYTFNNFGVPYQGTQGLYPSNLFNAELAWELTKKIEVGLEIGLLKDKVFFTTSYFRNRSSNQLVATPLPDITGFNSISANLPATVQNAGWEFMARTYNAKTKDFSWVSSINFTIQQNKLVAFPNLDKSTYAKLVVIGEPVSVIQAYHSIGVNPQTGLYSFLGAKGDTTSAPNTSTNENRYIRLNPDPTFFGGFQNTFTFKNFDIDLFFLFVKQIAPNPLFLNASQPGVFSRFTPLNWPVEILNNRWQKPGDAAAVQKFTRITGAASDAYTAASQSDYGYVDGSYIRLKNISVGYRLPVPLVKKMHLQHVRIYLQGQNVFTITSYKGIDPEAQNIAALPPLRVITAGIQVGL
jgi:TonB-linked SusC/RagA family outer membrane protein